MRTTHRLVKQIWMVICFCLLPALFMTNSTKAASASNKQPNVLFIAIDDLNDWVNCMGGRKRGKVHTPNLDRLAQKGMLFMNANCAAPACNPSRTAIMFGVRPSTSGVYVNNQPYRLSPVLEEAQTLPQFLRGQGYKAIGGGKLFHSLEWNDGETDGYNDPASWDAFFPSIKRQMPHRVMPPSHPISGSPGKERAVPDFFDWGPIGHPSEDMPDHKVINWALQELSVEPSQPMFLAVGIFRPHIPWYVPQSFFDLYPLDEIQVPYNAPGWREKLPPAGQKSGLARRKWHEWVVDNEEWKKAVRGYLASISFADYQLGRLLDGLENGPWAKDTIIVLWTDHGFHLGDKTTWEKFTLWEESTQVPLMIVAPGVSKPGSVCHQPASLIDVYPTILELLNLADKIPKSVEGTSLVPQLRDPNTKREIPAICTNERNNHSVRDVRYHYIRYENGDEELYDHDVDEGEWNNLAQDPAFAQIKQRLSGWVPSVNAEYSQRGGPIGGNGIGSRRSVPKSRTGPQE